MRLSNVNKTLFCCAGLLFTSGVLHGFDLVKNGNPAVIVLPENADPSSRLAAQELSDYTGKVTGVKLPVVTGKSDASNTVYIGTLQTLKNIPADAAAKLKNAKQDEAHFICAKGNTLWIIGKHEVAELYGTYQFIEDKLGVRWLKPEDKTDSGEYVPKRRDIVFANYEKFREPVFAFRRLDQVGSYGQVIPVKGKTWATRNGYQTPPAYGTPIPYDKKDSLKYKFYVSRIPHSQNCLGGGHLTFVQPMPPRTTFDKHPEYFALIDGKRVKGQQYCISNPEVRRNVADYIIRKLDAHHGLGFYNFGMVDVNGGWCECAECRKLDGGDTMAGGFQNVSTRFQKTVRAIAEMVYQKYPDADLRVWAYHTYRQLPEGVKIHPKMKLQFCPHGRCYGHALDDPNCPRNVRMYKLLKEWLKVGPKDVFTYEYLTSSGIYYVCHEQMIGHDLRLYRKLGMAGWKEEALFADSKFYPPKKNDIRGDLMPSNWQWAYITGKLLWDPSLDENKLLDEAENLYYDKAYPPMKKYHALRRKLWANTPVCMGYPHGDPRRPNILNQPGAKEELLKLLDEADKLAAGDKILQYRLANDRRWLKDYWIKANEEVKALRGKTMRAPDAKSKIIIDGDGKDRAWGGAYYLTADLKQAFTAEKKALPPELKTTLGVLSDKENLYFLITAMEPSPGKMKMTGKADVDVWGDDSIEIFLYPPTAANVYYHLVINPTGAVYDALGTGNAKDFNIPVEVKTRILKDRYVIEAKVPLAKLKLPENGEIWRLGFARNRNVDDALTPKGIAYSGNFSLGGSNYHDVNAFRPLEFGTPILKNGAFEALDKNGKPKFWSLRKKAALIKSEIGNAIKLESTGDAFQLIWWEPLRQSPQERKIAFTFKASGKGKVTVRFYRYTDTPDPKAKNGYRRKYNGADTAGVYQLTEKPQIYQGEYMIKPNEWIAFAFTGAPEAIVDDASIRLVK